LIILFCSLMLALPVLIHANESNKILVEKAVRLNSLGIQKQQLGDYAEAVNYFERVVEIRKLALGIGHPLYAESLNNLATSYVALGSYSKALPLLKKAIDIDRKALGTNDPKYATDLNNLAEVYRKMGTYTKALPLFRKAILILKQTLGVSHPLYARSQNNLAALYLSMGLYSKALPLFKLAVQINKQSVGTVHPDYALSLSNLALTYLKMGLYSKALPLSQQSIDIWKRTLGTNHPYYALGLNELAGIYASLGRYGEALPLFEQASNIYKKTLGSSHPLYAMSLNNIASSYSNMGSYEKARKLYEQVSNTYKRTLGSSHPLYATSLNNVSVVTAKMGLYKQALLLNKKTLKIRKESLGTDHPDYALSVFNRASLYGVIGSNTKALLFFQQACELLKAALGNTHIIYAQCLRELAFINGVTNKPDNSLKYFLSAQKIIDRTINDVFVISTEKQKLKFVKRQEGGYHGMLSLIYQKFRHNESALQAGLDLVLSRKSIVFDAQARQQEAIVSSLDPETRKLWELQIEKRAYLATLIQSKMKGANTETNKARIRVLQVEITKLESALASKSALIDQQVQLHNVRVEQLSGKLAKNSVLAEFVKINDYDWGKGEWVGTSRYLVFVLNHSGKVQLIDLGDSDTLESDVQAALKSLGAIGTAIQKQVAASRNLYDLIWQPIISAVGDAKSVVLSPDGLLNLVPFNALRNQAGQYLIESKELAYVTSGRDLAKVDTGIKAKSGLFLAANPQFDLIAQAPEQSETHSSVHSTGFSMYFPPLLGTAEEAKQIPTLLQGNATIVTGKEATEASVLAAKRPRVMHLATHGFFLKDQPTLTYKGTRGFVALNNDSSWPTVSLPKGYENPLVRSGLAFAGANRSENAKRPRLNDGLLTALEVTAMDLHGTDLVTLSACETGIGEIRSGEGVFGLRRAFSLAGAKHLVMSLWSVSDDITATQMRNFYQAYGQGTPPAKAMRQAQLDTITQLRQSKGIAAPALWAPFIVQGK